MFVKAGRGLDIEHKGSGVGHRYESLGIMRAPSNTLEPLRVTLTERSNTFPLYQHAGTELIYMLSGRMEYGYGSSRYLLESGDVLQFIGGVPHGPQPWWSCRSSSSPSNRSRPLRDPGGRPGPLRCFLIMNEVSPNWPTHWSEER